MGDIEIVLAPDVSREDFREWVTQFLTWASSDERVPPDLRGYCAQAVSKRMAEEGRLN
jgi:hypothetical protein